MIARIVTLCMLAAPYLLAWQLEPTVLLRGVVRHNGAPANVELLFRDESGKAVRAKSAADGSYQTVLAPGRTYSITITTDNLERFTYTLTSPPSNKFSELTQDFSLAETVAESATSRAKSSSMHSTSQTKKPKRKKR
ncbi:MAG: hypothetical protein KatS3mg038_3437 [Candidatus Kapaibacterium sp.]|nr:MAG: hypothetical protein KatS3mg038_3437 [Candidatus Kapabacteria bacterium]GIV55901.1 MAG: hypothetical protein KatS3mg040_0669 [Candidatus Kapabacteria bacterium]